jgi:hypothetical protein
MDVRTYAVRIAVVTTLVLGLGGIASAQLSSGAQGVTVTASLPESLTLSLSATTVNFPLTAGNAANAGSANVTASTKWVLKPGRSAVSVYAYFASAAAALTDGAGNNIPSSAFSISDNSATAAPLVNTVPFGGGLAGLQLEDVAITGSNRNSSVTDNMAFSIDLTGGSLPQLPAGNYSGVLYVQAQATP